MADKKEYALDNFKSTANLTSNPSFKSSVSISSKQIDDEKSYNPFEQRNLTHPNSTVGSILHLLKACLGSGILAMPAAFKNAGLVAGSIGTIFAGFLCTHAVHMLVKTSQDVCVDARKPLMGYAETCGAAFTYGPSRVRRWGGTIKTIVDISMFVAYFGILCVYIVFIATSFKEVLDAYIPERKISIQAYCACTLIPLLLVCQIRNLKYLVPFSLLANILVLVVFGITLYYIFSDVPDICDRELVADISQWPLFFSTVIFAMEGIGVVMPVENEMKKPQQFLGCPGVLNISMTIVISLYGVVGFFGYVKYGDGVRGSITLNLPQDEWVAQCAKILMAIVIFLSYTLQFYVPMEMVTRALEKRWTSYTNIIQIFVRIFLVGLSVGVAAAFPNLEMVISLVGAIFLSTLGLLIPAIIDTVYNWDRGLGPCNYVLYKNIIIGLLSILALIAGSYVSIEDILRK